MASRSRYDLPTVHLFPIQPPLMDIFVFITKVMSAYIDSAGSPVCHKPFLSQRDLLIGCKKIHT